MEAPGRAPGDRASRNYNAATLSHSALHRTSTSRHAKQPKSSKCPCVPWSGTGSCYRSPCVSLCSRTFHYILIRTRSASALLCEDSSHDVRHFAALLADMNYSARTEEVLVAVDIGTLGILHANLLPTSYAAFPHVYGNPCAMRQCAWFPSPP